MWDHVKVHLRLVGISDSYISNENSKKFPCIGMKIIHSKLSIFSNSDHAAAEVVTQAS